MKNLTSKKLLTRNSLFNLIGNIIPLILAVIVIPIIINHFGKERFGMLTILWAIIGYFNFIDFGVSRALTIIISEKLATNKVREIPSLINTALVIVTFFSLLGTFILLLSSQWLVYNKLQISYDLRGETLNSLYIIALSVPIIALTSSLKAITIAYQKFFFINIQRLLLSSIMFLSPLIIIFFSNSLTPIISLLFIGRIIIFISYIKYTNKIITYLIKNVKIKIYLLKQILKFGGWLTITNIIGPVMVYLDRVIMGIWIPVKSVTYYSSVHEVVTKILILPGSIMNVIFPAFSYTYAKNPNKSLNLLRKSIISIFILLFPILFFFITFTKEILSTWLGNDFLINSSLIMQILLIGIFFNSIAQIYFFFIQGIGKPNITAIIHIIELPIYLFFLWYLIQKYGIKGAAFVWTFRVVLDTVVLMLATSILFSKEISFLTNLYYFIGFSITILIIPIFIDNLIIRSIYFFSLCSITLIAFWIYFLDDVDKADLVKLLQFYKYSK